MQVRLVLDVDQLEELFTDPAMGNNPARTSDDFPDPLAPRTGRNAVPSAA
jgi:hypothetical protein